MTSSHVVNCGCVGVRLQGDMTSCCSVRLTVAIESRVQLGRKCSAPVTAAGPQGASLEMSAFSLGQIWWKSSLALLSFLRITDELVAAIFN